LSATSRPVVIKPATEKKEEEAEPEEEEEEEEDRATKGEEK